MGRERGKRHVKLTPSFKIVNASLLGREQYEALERGTRRAAQEEPVPVLRTLAQVGLSRYGPPLASVCVMTVVT